MQTAILLKLQQEILQLQGYKPAVTPQRTCMNLGTIEAAFPYKIFPIGAIHEFSSTTPEDAAATHGFITALLGKLLQTQDKCIWIGRDQHLYPPGLTQFGINPSQIIFIESKKPADILWTIEEALKCDTLKAVVGLTDTLSFTKSRRLQLAVEQSGVTGFIHRTNATAATTIACAARWRIKPAPSINIDNLPGVGFTHWNVSLLKVRNGKPGNWPLQWINKDFYMPVEQARAIATYQQLQTG